MARIVVSERACEMLQRHALKDVIGAARRQEDGLLEIEISNELLNLIIGARFLDEPVSQTIIRVLPTWTGGRR